MDFIQFMNRFKDEQSFRQDLFNLRWSGGYSCLRCGHLQYLFIQSRELFECRECGFQCSVTAGTMMHGTRLPLSYWYFTMYWMASDTVCSARKLSQTLSINYRSALRMMHTIRAAMRNSTGNHILDFEKAFIKKSMEADLGSQVKRIKAFLQQKAHRFIQVFYRKVGERHLQSYLNEFVFHHLGRFLSTSQRVAALFEASLLPKLSFSTYELECSQCVYGCVFRLLRQARVRFFELLCNDETRNIK